MLKIKMEKDGDQWGVLIGENLQEGVSGFGKSPKLALIDLLRSVEINDVNIEDYDES